MASHKWNMVKWLSGINQPVALLFSFLYLPTVLSSLREMGYGLIDSCLSVQQILNKDDYW